MRRLPACSERSSSAIVTKLLVELHRLTNPESRLILGIIVFWLLHPLAGVALLAPAQAAARFDRRRVPPWATGVMWSTQVAGSAQ